ALFHLLLQGICRRTPFIRRLGKPSSTLPDGQSPRVAAFPAYACYPVGEPKPPGQDGRRRMVASDSFAEFLREQLAPLGHVRMRRMFAKTGVFCDGVMFGMVADNTLYFRVDDHNRTAFKEAASA